MRYALLTASTAAMLLSSTAIWAQEAPVAFDNVDVDVDVDGAAVQVPIALAAQACGVDEAAVREAAVTRLEESGLDPAALRATNVATESVALSDAEAQQGGAAAPSTTGAAADAPGATTAEDSGDTAGAPEVSNGTVTTAQGTADPSTAAPGDKMLALAVCQIDVVTAADLGIPQANEIVTD